MGPAMRDLEREFAEDLQEYYPGSSKPVVRHPNRSVVNVRNEESQGWDENPRSFNVQGRMHQFFTVGHLAKAIGRKPGTIRGWERDGVIPRDRKSTRLNSSHCGVSRMPSSA